MALLLFEGYEGITTAQMSIRYANTSGDIGNPGTPAPPNGQSWRGNAAQQNWLSLGATPATVVVGFRYLPRQLAQAITTQIKVLQLVDDIGTIHLTIRCELNGAITAYRGDVATLLGTSSGTNILRSGYWSYVEVKATIDDSTGAVEVKVDGTSVLNLTSQDTRNGGNANVSQIRIGSHTGTGSYSYADDVYVCDTTGSAPYNDYLGDVRVVMMVPDGAGDSTQWTPSAGANYAAVDETPGHDGDTSYVSSSTAGQDDLYTVGATPSGSSQVWAARVTATARKEGAGARDIALLVKAGTTTDASGALTIPDTTYREFSYTLLQNPDTSADWTIADLDAAQIGIRIPV